MTEKCVAIFNLQTFDQKQIQEAENRKYLILPLTSECPGNAFLNMCDHPQIEL